MSQKPPIVDLTQTIAGMRRHAEAARDRAYALADMVVAENRAAAHWTALADTLEGATDPGDDT